MHLQETGFHTHQTPFTRGHTYLNWHRNESIGGIWLGAGRDWQVPGSGSRGLKPYPHRQVLSIEATAFNGYCSLDIDGDPASSVV